jgi:hypothetical protein
MCWVADGTLIGSRQGKNSHTVFIQDIDDAMHATVLPNGDVEVGVSYA